jgi:hypothetical protein
VTINNTILEQRVERKIELEARLMKEEENKTKLLELNNRDIYYKRKRKTRWLTTTPSSSNKTTLYSHG